MELVHLNDSVKREGTNGDSSNLGSKFSTDLVPLKVSIKDLNLSYVFDNATDVARGRIPRFFGGVLVNARAVAFGTLDQDTIKDIKSRYVDSDFDEFNQKKVYFECDLDTLSLATIKESVVDSKDVVLDLPRKSKILDKLYTDMGSDTDPKVLAEVTKIPLTPFNYWDIYKLSNVKWTHDGLEVKLARGAKLVGSYESLGTVTSAIGAYIAEENPCMNKFKFYASDVHISTLVRILYVDYEIKVEKGIIGFVKRELPPTLRVEWRVLFLEKIRRKILDKLVSDFNGSRVLHTKTTSTLAIVYAWIVDNFIMTDDIRYYFEIIDDYRTNCFTSIISHMNGLGHSECIEYLRNGLECFKLIEDSHLSGKVHGMPHRDLSHGLADEEAFRIEYAMAAVRQIEWRNQTNNLYVIGYLSLPFVDAIVDYRRFYGGNAFRFSEIKSVESPFDPITLKGTHTIVFMNDAVLEIMEVEGKLEKLFKALDAECYCKPSTKSAGLHDRWEHHNYVVMFEISSVSCVTSGVLDILFRLRRKVTVVYPDGAHFIIWIIVYGEEKHQKDLDSERSIHLNILYKMMVEYSTLWYLGMPTKGSMFVGPNRKVDHSACYFYGKRAIRRYRDALRDAFDNDSRISIEGVINRKLLVSTFYEERREESENKRSQKKNS